MILTDASVRTVAVARAGNVAIAAQASRIPHQRATALVVVATLVVTGVTFGLPHLLIPRILGPDQQYTPFAVSGVSSLTYDKTSTYAASANYTALRLSPPYDTDLWETQNVPVPTTTAPFFALAALDRLAGGLDKAFIICDFVLPALATFFVYRLFVELAVSQRTALAGSLATILIAFGPRNFLGVPLMLLANRGSSIVQPLEFSRLLHPELSFTVLAAALLLLWRTLQTGGRVHAVLGGVAGGLLFYTYVYYFPIWLGACTLLLLARRWLTARALSGVAFINLSTWIVSLPFWLSFLQSRDTSNFTMRLTRHYSELGHMPPPDKLMYTAECIVIFTVIAISFARYRKPTERSQGGRWKQTVLLFHSSVFVAALAALNVEVILGYNLEAMNHYGNRFFQPYLLLTGFTLLVPSASGLVPWIRSWSPRTTGILASCAVGALLAMAITRQTIVSINVADKHALRAKDGLLFDWLNSHTHLNDVVLTSDRRVNELIPVFTHNLLFVPNGERTSANDAEIERRFLIAMRLLQHPETDVRDLLARDYQHGDQPLGLTYTYFLFVSGNYSHNMALPGSRLTPLLEEYRRLDLAIELGRWRLNYVYGNGSERPAAVPGWTFRRVYSNEFGNVWEAAATGGASQAGVSDEP